MNLSVYEKSKRIVLVDSLRGFALMGLFLVHMVEYFELYWYKPEPSIFNDLTFFLFGGKAYAIFALLFGFSYFIIMDGQSKRGIDFRACFVWRLMLLFLFGLIHGLIYGGDILQILAITGFFLIPIYNARNSILVLNAFFFLLQVPAILYLSFFVDQNALQEPMHYALFGPVFNVYANGTFTELIETTLWNAQLAKWAFMLESGRLFTILGMSILGFWLGKIEFFRKVENYLPQIKVIFPLSFSLTIVFIAGASEINSFVNPNQNWIIATIVQSYTNLLFTLTGIFAFVIMYQFNLPQKIMSLLAPCGRMSLTIYVSQSFVFVPFFYGFGFGAYDFIGQTYSFFLGIVFWILQVIVATYWMKRFYFGPLEWIWRSATYFSRDILFRRFVNSNHIEINTTG